jgi:DNA-binding response OmpR family regulator
MGKTLLSVGTNFTLLQLRNMVFVNAGYKVLPARSRATALKIIASEQLDGVIVGHTLSVSLRRSIVAGAKRKRLPVIVLHAHAHEEQLLDADANLVGIDGAARIVEVLSELMLKHDMVGLR